MRAPFALLTVALLLVSQLTAAADDPPKTPAQLAAEKRRAELSKRVEGAKLSGFVVLRSEAYPTQKDALASDAPSQGLSIADATRRSGGAGWAWKVVSDDGPTALVESLPGNRYGDGRASGHCSDGAASDPFRVRAHVRRSDLQAVLVERVKEDFADGTGFELEVGVAVDVPLLPLRGGLGVSAEGLHFEAKVPLKAVGLSYPAPATFPVKRKRNELTLGSIGIMGEAAPAPPKYSAVAEHLPIYLNDEAFATTRQLSADLREVQSSVARGDEELLELAGPCLRLRVLGKSSTGGGGSGAAGLGGREKIYLLSKGAAAHYPDGTRAGESTGVMRLTGEGAEINGRRCYKVSVGVRAKLCFDPSSLKEEK